MFADCLNCGQKIVFDETEVQIGDELHCSQCGNDYILESISPVKIFQFDTYSTRSKPTKSHKKVQRVFDHDEDEMDLYADVREPKRKTRKPWNKRNAQRSSFDEDMKYYNEF